MAKVIGKSNFNLESVSDILVADKLTTQEAIYLVISKNEETTERSTYYYEAVDDDYELYDHTKNY